MQCLNTFIKAELSDNRQLWGKRKENTAITNDNIARWLLRWSQYRVLSGKLGRIIKYEDYVSQ